MRAAIVGLGMVLGFGSGCVAQKDHDQLRADFDRATQELTASRSAEADLRASLTKKLADARTREEELRGQIADLNTQLSANEVESFELEQRLAKMVSDHGELEASIAEMTEALVELRRRRAASERRVAAYRDLLGRFQSLIDAGALKVKIIDGRMVVQLQTDVLFASGSATLSAEGEAAIADVSTVLAQIPKRRYQIEGHTDDVPIKSKTYGSNWELAAARALNVAQAMVTAGLAPERVSAASFSEYRPVASNADAASRAQNRRIEIVVVPNLEDLPGANELAGVR